MTELANVMYENAGVRILGTKLEPWFVGKDVCDALGYKNHRKAIDDHVDEDDKGVTECYTLGGAQTMIIVNEAGLYSLIFGSNLPAAKAFKRWVTHEVLPQIRRTGKYVPPKPKPVKVKPEPIKREPKPVKEEPPRLLPREIPYTLRSGEVLHIDELRERACCLVSQAVAKPHGGKWFVKLIDNEERYLKTLSERPYDDEELVYQRSA